MLFKRAIAEFIRHLDSIDRSQETITGYGKELKYIEEYLSEKYNSMVYVEDIKLDDLEQYMNYLKDKGNKSASRSRVIYVLRSFYNYVCRKGICDKNIAELMEPVKVKQEERTYLTDTEFQELRDEIEHEIVKAVVDTIYYTGLRVSEVTNLTLDDIDMGKGVIQVIGGKGNKDRKVPISSKLKPILQDYLDNVRPETKSYKFFCTKRTGKVSAQSINRELHKSTDKLKWSKKVTAHILRHSFASNLVSNDAPLASVQKLLGHSDLRVTSRYIHQSMDELEDAVNLL